MNFSSDVITNNSSIKSALELNNIIRTYKDFCLNIPELKIPRGLATALIGENGAGKTTLMNIIMGIDVEYKGSILYFDKYSDKDREADGEVKNLIGYTGSGKYYSQQWTIEQIENISSLLFDDFSRERFEAYCKEFKAFSNGFDKKRKIQECSEGTKAKLMLSNVLSRDTDILIMDEPAANLDPLMRDRLCDSIRSYMAEKEDRTVFFSTHDIQDMESITDYAVIMSKGKILEQGFVEDLKEKYKLVKGEPEASSTAQKVLFSINQTSYGFEGICLSKDLDKLTGLPITMEKASLFRICVEIMKKSQN